MSPLSTKRNVLAEHLKEVIDTMEQKVSVASAGFDRVAHSLTFRLLHF